LYSAVRHFSYAFHTCWWIRTVLSSWPCCWYVDMYPSYGTLLTGDGIHWPSENLEWQGSGCATMGDISMTCTGSGVRRRSLHGMRRLSRRSSITAATTTMTTLMTAAQTVSATSVGVAWSALASSLPVSWRCGDFTGRGDGLPGWGDVLAVDWAPAVEPIRKSPPGLLILQYCNYCNNYCNTFYARKQLLLSARINHRNSVRPSVCHTGGSVKSGAS